MPVRHFLNGSYSRPLKHYRSGSKKTCRNTGGNLRPNDETRPYAVLTGCVGTVSTNLLAHAFGATINYPLVLVGAGFMLIAIGMEMWVMYKTEGDE